MANETFDFMSNFQKMHEKLEAFQDKAVDFMVTGLSGGGMVEIDMNGRFEILAVRIAKEAWMPKDGGTEPDIEMVQDLIVSACAAARRRAQWEILEKAGSVAESVGLPRGLFRGLPD